MNFVRDNLPLVSVCIPAYNHEKYIVDCLKSVIAQTYQNIELVIIDDGSSDGTGTKILGFMPKLQKRFVRVFFESQPNMGTCGTINKLYKNADGKYIYHIASDDMAKPNAIQTLVDFMENNSEYALAVGDNEIIDGNGVHCFWDDNRNNVYDENIATYKTFGMFLKNVNSDIDFNSDQFGKYSTLVRGNYVPNGYLIRRDILNQIGSFTPDAPLEDWWFMLQISKYAKIKYLDQVLFAYRWHGTNTAKDTIKMQKMGDKTIQYENRSLKRSSFLGMLPEVKHFIRHEKLRKFVHKYVYHRTAVGNYIIVKIFGVRVLKYHRKSI